MKKLPISASTLALIGVGAVLLVLFVFAALRSGPLAPVPVTVATVEMQPINPALFGIGTVEARYTYRIGPTVAGRLRSVTVQVGDLVQAGQILGEMDPVDLDERVAAQEAGLQRGEAAVRAAEAQVHEVAARATYANGQAQRYEKLLPSGAVSVESVEARKQESQIAEAALAAASANLDSAIRDLARAGAERAGVRKQRANLRLLAPVAGLVSLRAVESGSTVVAGQTVVEIIDPASLWVSGRFIQLGAGALSPGLAATIVLRSRAGQVASGRILRLEPLADPVTEETLAKVAFDTLPQPLPGVGELAEITVGLPTLAAAPVVPNASVQRLNGRPGVWLYEEGRLRFAPVKMGGSDLDGRVQILEGLKVGEQVVVYSPRALREGLRVKLVAQQPGV
ncbi:MAG TPA: efflux RND transporter periplasmic adaptor subunit [Desulfurivibrionaceae bacterium]|nr:efflux RND transporter periplasmic adaptor subunit [Desulfurivibrionaceae bacterium]